MAWCGPNFSVVRVGPGAEGRSRLMCMGASSPAFTTELQTCADRPLRVPQTLPFASEVVQVAFGRAHWALVSASFCLFTAGQNDHGQLGRTQLGAGPPRRLGQVDLCGRVESVSCGEAHTVAVLSRARGRSAWGWGSNGQHQLGADDRASGCAARELDVPQPAGSGGVRVAAGRRFTVVAVGATLCVLGADAPCVSDSELSAVLAPLPGTSVVKHLVAGGDHVLVGYVDGRRLRVWGMGGNAYRQLGFPAAQRRIDAPREIVFGCPPQAADDFPSMLAASNMSSVVMVNGQVWSMGWQEARRFVPDDDDATFWSSQKFVANRLDPRCFDNLPVAYVGAGPQHAVFATTCGRLYVRGSCAERSEAGKRARNNGLPTAFRQTKRGVVAVCESGALEHPRRVPAQLFGGHACCLWRLELKLAVAMAAHPRLGSASALARFDTLVLQMIADFADAAPLFP